jgi:hypothetical protein
VLLQSLSTRWDQSLYIDTLIILSGEYKQKGDDKRAVQLISDAINEAAKLKDRLVLVEKLDYIAGRRILLDMELSDRDIENLNQIVSKIEPMEIFDQ